MNNYLGWAQRCSQCNREYGWRVTARSVLVKAFLAGCFAWLASVPPVDLGFVLAATTLVYFTLVIVIDLEHHLILHPVSLVGAGLGLVLGVHLHGWRQTLTGGAAGFGIMLGLYFMGLWLVKRMSRWKTRTTPDEDETSTPNTETEGEALGFGDVTLAGVVGLMLGWPGIVLGIALTIVLGGIGGLTALLVALVKGKYRATLAIPYGPFLASAALLLLLLNEQLVGLFFGR